MIIRPETVADYAAIGELNARAFGNRAGEALLIPLLRHGASFDPGLALVAEEAGRVVGYALFVPYTLRLLGADVAAVNLAPLAVEPALQRQGIGGRLLEAGHAAARERGYALSFLLGHPDYYPRFGYLTHAFGVSTVALGAARGPAPAELMGSDEEHGAPRAAGASPGDTAELLGAEPGSDALESRAPTPADLPALQALWHHEEGAVDMALAPGPGLLDWLSSNPQIAARVWLRDGAIAGYTRVHAAEASEPRVFLAATPEAARAIAAALFRAAGTGSLKLPLHPASASTAALGEAAARSWDAAMACPLAPSAFDDYYAQLRAGQRPPGRVTWPVAFDIV